MKKSILLVAIMAFVGATTVVAQPRAIGVNLGYGVDLSYQHSLGEANMVDFSINIPLVHNTIGIGATATYDWIDPFGTAIPWDYKGEWKWSLGVGAGAGAYSLLASNEVVNAEGKVENKWGGSIYAGVVGHVGVEYDFWFPMQLSLDYRPNVGINLNGEGLSFNKNGFYGITLGVRYLL